MKQIAWITDPHFDYLSDLQVINFYSEINQQQIDSIFLTGDISTAELLPKHLSWLASFTQKPIYYVIGNHDLWGSYLHIVEQNLRQLSEKYTNLHYLPNTEDILLNDNTGLIGENGFYDASWRKPLTNFVFLWDWFSIKDFCYLPSDTDRLDLMISWAEKYTQSIQRKLLVALKKYSTIYLLTHIPPWAENNYLLGEVANKFWAPYNSCKRLATSLVKIMNDYPKNNLIVLSGHTHKQRIEQISHNIELRVGNGHHGKAQIQEILVLKG